MWVSHEFDGHRQILLELLGLSLMNFSDEAELHDHLDRAIAEQILGETGGGHAGSPVAHYVPDPSVRFEQGPAYRLDYLAPINVHTFDGTATRASSDLRVSVIATVFNEMRTAAAWISSLVNQRFMPDEIIIVDAGSTDGTLDALRRGLESFSGDVELLEVPGASIAEGRNIAIDRCTGDVIVIMDGGCSYSDEYIGTLVLPHARGKSAVSACGYRAESSDAEIEWEWSPRFDEFGPAEWSTWLPSTRCMAISGDLKVRFPEWLTLTGDDTLFDIELRQQIKDWYFTSEVLVAWQAPKDRTGLGVLCGRYDTGDGESGARDNVFRPQISDGHSDSLGFGYGFAARPSIDVHRRGISRVWVLCSLTPFGDSGGAQRTSQLAAALARSGERVIFLSAERSYEDPNVRVWVDARWDLITLALPEDPWIIEQLTEYAELGANVVLALEAPHPRFAGLVDSCHDAGFDFQTHFSLIDDWNNSLGGGWFKADVQRSLTLQADSVSASARALMAQLSITHLPRHYLPNAADRRLFEPLPNVEPVKGRVTYAGSLWGNWIDWRAVLGAAALSPDMEFRLYGDLELPRRALVNARYPNVVLPGLVPQRELPAVYAAAQVLLIPFLLNEITEGTNPLKVHEYVLMGRPVVTTRLPEYQVFGDCRHLNFYEPEDAESLLEAITRAQRWDGVCPAESNGQHRGIFDWDQVALEYKKVADSTVSKVH